MPVIIIIVVTWVFYDKRQHKEILLMRQCLSPPQQSLHSLQKHANGICWETKITHLWDAETWERSLLEGLGTAWKQWQGIRGK